jgi:hypothetical protein
MKLRRVLASVGASALAVALFAATPSQASVRGRTWHRPAADAAHAAGGRAAACAWNKVSVPKPDSRIRLHAVAATSSSDVWAVGNKASGGDLFVLHFNGTKWKEVAAPGAGSAGVDLFGVDALTKSNAWAVGIQFDSQAHRRTLIEHWNGSAWKVVTSPNSGAGDNTLASVSAVSASDIWAVGFTGASPGDAALIEHWNGSKWSLVDAPATGGPAGLHGVSAISSTNVVAVGQRGASGGTLVERFDGESWSVEASADPEGGSSALFGVSAPSATAQWAAGTFIPEGGVERTLTERSTGGPWSIKSSPNVSPNANELFAVSARSAGKAFAVGYHETADGTRRTLAEAFADGAWKVQSTPNGSTDSNQLEGVVAISATNVWAVGSSNDDAFGFDISPLVEHLVC